eukprot:13206-Heterococcus_DN1.PRE.5
MIRTPRLVQRDYAVSYTGAKLLGVLSKTIYTYFHSVYVNGGIVRTTCLLAAVYIPQLSHSVCSVCCTLLWHFSAAQQDQCVPVYTCESCDTMSQESYYCLMHGSTNCRSMKLPLLRCHEEQAYCCDFSMSAAAAAACTFAYANQT